jgi:quercetin dioxygenase-like cupin family protein
MKEKTGTVISIAKDNAPVPGCTVSREIHGGLYSITYYSMAEHTDISAEIYPYHKLFLVAAGEMTVYTSVGTAKTLSEGDIIVAPTDIPVGIRTDKSVVFTEITIPKNENMNQAIKAGEVFTLAQLVPYQEGRIVNMDVVSNSKMKFVVMSFDAGTGLSEHAAPGEALIFALDGEAIIGYEGSEHHIKSGEQFHFAKGGLHSVKAIKQFKMALLLTLE